MKEDFMIRNPVIPGFYPDPSICRVGEDYYLVCSSFELYPGIPVFHSRDLVHWEQVSYAMTMENDFFVGANMGSGGVMAPTIRYHDGLFYIVCCNFSDKGNFYVSASNPSGPWSKPHWIEEVKDLDCSLFFDEDGKCCLVYPGDDETEDNGRAIFLVFYDLKEGRVCGERRKLWNSALRKAWAPEAPHLYHIGEYYYLLIAEGGTDHFHSVTVARSRTVDGMYEGYEGNPIITHRHLGWNYPIDNIGHADLVDTPHGEWYAVMLGSRLIEGQHKNLGREVFVCPVAWEREWPVMSPGTGKMELSYPADKMLLWTPYKEEPERDDFDSEEPGFHLCFWGTPCQDFWKIEDSRLKLRCLARPMFRQLKGMMIGNTERCCEDCVSFMGRRQRAVNINVTLKMEFVPQKKEAAGMIIMQAANHHFRFEKTLQEGRPVLRLVRLTTEQKSLPFLPDYEAFSSEEIVEEHHIENTAVILRMEQRGQRMVFQYGYSEDALQAFSRSVDGADINPEEVGGMTGTMLGMFATANGGTSNNQAMFDFFEVKEQR